MEFTIKADTLADAMRLAMRTVPGKPLQTVMDKVLLETTETELILTTNDGETQYRQAVPVDGAGKGKTLADAALLLELALAAGDRLVTFTAGKDADQATLSWDNGRAVIPVFREQVAEFVPIQEPAEPEVSVKVKAADLYSKVTALLPFVAKDLTRPSIMGILLDISEEGITAVATDTHSLINDIIPQEEFTGSRTGVIIPMHAASVLKTVLAKVEDDVTVTASQEEHPKAAFAFGDTTVTCRQTIGKFPDWQRIFPKDSKCLLTIGRDQLRTAIDTMLACGSGLSGHCSLTMTQGIGADALVLEAEDKGFATKGRQALDGEYSGDDLTVGIKGSYMVNILKAMPGETVTLGFNSEATPIVVKPTDPDASVRAIVMPVRAAKK